MKLRHLKWSLAFLLLLSVSVFAEGPTRRFTVVVNRMVDAINKQDYPSIQKDFGNVLIQDFPLKKSKPFFQKLVAQCGRIISLDTPRLISTNEAIFPVHFERAFIDIKITLDAHDRIVGLLFLPHTAGLPAPKKNATVLHLPFKGNWLVFWGGDTLALNHHHGNPAQNDAFDFLVVDKNGRTHRNDGKKNEDYYAFGEPVVAPAYGVVTDVIRGVRDNVPGSMNPYSVFGNSVIIQHQKGEVSVLAHFKQNSIRVKVGEKVKKGQVLGLCGNSGNSSEPHIHYHLQNTPIIQDARGIKCFFTNIRINRNGKTRTEKLFSPIKGDLVENK